MKGTTVTQFKELLPVSTAINKLSSRRKSVMMKLQNSWGKQTLRDLEKLTNLLGAPGSHLNLSIISPGCIAVHWLCLPSIVPELEKAIIAAASSLCAEGVQQVFIGDRLVLEPGKGIIFH